MTAKYRSIYTGQEIDEAISQIKAISTTTLVQDYSGGTNKIPSAELVKNLKETIDAVNSPSNIKTKLLANTNTKVLSDSEYALVNKLGTTSTFRGVFADAAARDAALSSQTMSYIGNEIVVVLNNGSGDSADPIPSIYRWNGTSWAKISLDDATGISPVTVATAGDYVLFSYRRDLFVGMKCLVAARDSASTLRQIQEVLISHMGSEIYISVYNEIGNTSALFDAKTSVVGNYVNLVINTKQTNVVLRGKKLAML